MKVILGLFILICTWIASVAYFWTTYGMIGLIGGVIMNVFTTLFWLIMLMFTNFTLFLFWGFMIIVGLALCYTGE